MYETAAVANSPYITTAKGVAPDTTSGVIESATNTISEAAKRVEFLVSQVRGLADATFGSQPQPGNLDRAAQVNPPSMGRAENLQRAGGSLHSAITALETEVVRLRGI